MNTQWGRRVGALTEHLVDAGALVDPAWRKVFVSVPRHVFVPDHDFEEAYADKALVTQTRAATTPDGGSLQLPTSSASQPSLVAVMLERLEVRDGMRVLEIGAGTGYNAALLASRLGDENVFSLDIDSDLIATARHSLEVAGRCPRLVAADGHEGLEDASPYDRIIATCAIGHVPPAWIRQLAPGGRIVAPLQMDGWTLAVLDKTADDEVTGRIDATHAAFMPLRSRVDSPLAAGQRLAGATGVGHYGVTGLDPGVVAEADADLRLFVSFHIPGLAIGGIDDQEVTLTAPRGHARASLEPNPDGQWRVIQSGHRLWDTAEHAVRSWRQLGKPDRTRYGISALDDPDRQYVWLDDPDSAYCWPLPTAR